MGCSLGSIAIGWLLVIYNAGRKTFLEARDSHNSMQFPCEYFTGFWKFVQESLPSWENCIHFGVLEEKKKLPIFAHVFSKGGCAAIPRFLSSILATQETLCMLPWKQMHEWAMLANFPIPSRHLHRYHLLQYQAYWSWNSKFPCGSHIFSFHSYICKTVWL